MFGRGFQKEVGCMRPGGWDGVAEKLFKDEQLSQRDCGLD